MTFEKTEKEYAALYNVSPRTVRRWKAKGWPLDDAEQIRLLLAAQGSKTAPLTNPDGTGGIPHAQGTGAVGLNAALERLRESERDAHASYLAARESGADETLILARQKGWLAFQKALLEAEKANPDVEQANQNVVSLEKLTAALSELFSKHRTDLENLAKRVAVELAEKDEVTVRTVLEREANALIAALYAFEFAPEEEEGGLSE